jgi:hypothetical protein
MKRFCDFKYTCLYSYCCTLEKYLEEFILTHYILLTTILLISIISTLIILKKKSYQFKSGDDDAQPLSSLNTLIKKVDTNIGNHSLKFNKKNYVSDSLSLFNYFNLISNIFTKYLIIYLILSKLLEVFIIQNYFSKIEESFLMTNAKDVLRITTRIVFSLFMLLASFNLIHFTTQVIEYYKRFIISYTDYHNYNIRILFHIF